MKVLVINCGSSSLKYQILDMTNESLLCKGLVERIGMDGSVITHEKIGQDKVKTEVPMNDHKDAIEQVLAAVQHAEYGVVKSMDEIGAVGHRVVHAGEKFAKPVNPKIYGYDFAGWFTTDTFETEYDFDQVVGVNGLTIYAKWEKVTYDFTGDPAVWTPDSGKDLVITAKRSAHDETTFDHFAGIEIDGQIVDKANYKTSRGSIVVTLSKDYLKTLKSGDHTVKVLFDDNDPISTSLTIKEAQAPKGSDKESAQTGEHASVLLLIVAVVLLISGTITGLIARKSKNN